MDTLTQGTQAIGPDAGLRSPHLQSVVWQAEGVLQEERVPELTVG